MGTSLMVASTPSEMLKDSLLSSSLHLINICWEPKCPALIETNEVNKLEPWNKQGLLVQRIRNQPSNNLGKWTTGQKLQQTWDRKEFGILKSTKSLKNSVLRKERGRKSTISIKQLGFYSPHNRKQLKALSRWTTSSNLLNYFNCCVKNVPYKVKHGSWEPNAIPNATTTNCSCFVWIAIKTPHLLFISYDT